MSDTNCQTPDVPTPANRLSRIVGATIEDVLRGDDLIVLDAHSPRACWHATLERAAERGDASGVAALIGVGAEHGWLFA